MSRFCVRRKTEETLTAQKKKNSPEAQRPRVVRSEESFEMMMITTIIPRVMVITTILGILALAKITSLRIIKNCCRHLHPPSQYQQGLHSSNEVRRHSVSFQ